MTMSGYLYTASAGESFDSAALECYGDEKFAAELICANPEHGDKLTFSGGERLRLPIVDAATDRYGRLLKAAPWKE